MAFVVPQHLPRTGYTQGSSFGSETSHAEPVLRKLAEATRDSLTAAEASKWADELQKSIEETKTRVHQRIQKDLPAFERQLNSAKQIQTGLEELTSVADNLADRVQSPQTGLLPTILTRLAAHSVLAQETSDAKLLHDAIAYLAHCRDEFKALSALVTDGHLPAAVCKTEEAQSLIQTAPRPLERSAVMRDLSRLARVLGDRVQEQLGDAYARAIAVTPFPTGATVVVLPHVTIRDSNGVVTLSELFTSLTAASLQERLSTLRKDILAKALEPILTKPSRLVTSSHESTLTIDHTPPSDANPSVSTQQAHDALLHTISLVTFLNDTLFPSLPPQQANFGAQLAGPISQALITHVLRPAVPRSGSLDNIPDFLRVAKHAAEVEEAMFKLGLRSGDVREWAQAAPAHYERRRREDLVQHVRGVVMERDGSAVAVKRTIIRSKEEGKEEAEAEDPWAFEQSVSPPRPGHPQVPIIATPIPAQRKASHPTATPYFLGEPPNVTASPPTEPPKVKSPPPKVKSPPPEEEVDNWGFDEDEPKSTESTPAKPAGMAGTQNYESGAEDTSEDEPDVEVYAGTSQSEGGGTSRSANTSHPTELLSAPQSDAEVVNAGQSSEESDPWDDDPWAEPDEAEAGDGEKKEEAPVSPSKSPAPTLSPTKAPEPPAQPTPAPPVVVEIPPSPAVHAPAPRVARGLERFAQKSRASPSPTPSKFNSPIISNSSPTTISSSSAFGTAPTSAIPQSATYAHSNTSYSSPPKSQSALPNPYASPAKSFTSPAAPPAPFVSSKPPTIAPPITPAMRRAQQQAKLAAAANGGRPTSPFGGSQSAFGTSESGSVVGSPGKRRDTLQREDRGSISSATGGGLFGFGGSQHGGNGSVSGQSVFGSPERRVASVSSLPLAPPPVQVHAPAPPREEPTTETSLVSKKAQKVLALAEEALREGNALAISDIFPPDTTPSPGTLVLGCIPSFFDLFRALVPVTHGGPMAASSGIAMRFSNDCIFLSEEIVRLIADVPEGPVGDGAKSKFEEVQERLKALGESWFEDVLDNEKQAIAKYLEPAEGFLGMQDLARFQECKRAVTRCTQAVTKFSRDTKAVLSFTKYYLALGTLVEDVLVRLNEDILAMPDIPETESHRLHDICKIVHAFETLFLVEGESTSMVTMHVPSWFKYSYLSELLEASLADIRHLFDIGALVDFSEQDLAHLIRALFSDSPKRQELVDRVLAGHPSQT